MKFPEARIVLCKCQEGRKLFGIRMEQCENYWNATWAFPIKESSAKRENYDETEITGGVRFLDEFPGCPYCHTHKFVVCGTCGKLNCNPGIKGIFTCEWCGAQGELGGYDGAGIKSGSDL